VGILTYIKIGAIVLALAVGFGGAWYVQNLRATNKRLVQENKNQTKTIEFMRAAAAMDTATVKEKEEINEVVKTGDPKRIADVLLRLRRMSGQTDLQPRKSSHGP